MKYLTLFFLLSCSKLLSSLDNPPQTPLTGNKNQLALFFSHNINGETHPCGCRHFPLGGLPQLAGIFHEEAKKSHLFYVDTGDSLFPSPLIPQTRTLSLSFGAENLALGLEKLGLKLFVPGEKDLAMGWEFLAKQSQERKFIFLITNLQDKKVPQLKHQNYYILKAGKRALYFLSVIDPNVVPSSSRLLSSPQQAIEKVLKQLRADGHRPEAPENLLILLSHSGLEADKKLAKKFPQIDWIIGSHTQSFLRKAVDEGSVNIVQAVSKNHYLGKILIPLNTKERGTYSLIEVHQDLEKKLSPNPYIAFITEHKKEMTRLQEKEEKLIIPSASSEKLTTYISCQSCHEAQTDFWQGTAHSLAYLTLINANQAKDPSCIGCHSLGYENAKGFTSTQDMVLKNKKRLVSKDFQSYWKGLEKITPKTSIREMSSDERKKKAKAWLSTDKAQKITHNFANVQCLNCHSKHPGHPFDDDPAYGADAMKNKCLSCHDSEQSPGWYQAAGKSELNQKAFKKALLSVSCPKS